MNPVAPVTSAVLFDSSFTYPRVGGTLSRGTVSLQGALRPSAAVTRTSSSTGVITDSLERTDLTAEPEEDPKTNLLHSNLHG